MTRLPLLVLASLAALTCGGLPIAAPTATASPTPARTATPTTAVSALPSVTPITSAKGGITVRVPLANARITSPVTVSGDASVFEAAVQWRIVDAGGRVFAEGNTTASAGAPARGAFSVSATFTPPTADTIGSIEVYDRSPKDGTIDELVRVPVVITH